MARSSPNRDPIVAIGRSFAVAAATLCLLPLPLLLAVATTPVWQQGLWSGGFTLRWLAESWSSVGPYAWFSLRLALLTLLFNMLLGMPAAWAIARRNFAGRAALLALINLPLAIPGIALALALILSYPTWRAGGILLLAGHTLYTLPFFVGALVPALAQPALREREHVAATLGAGVLRRLLFVTLPAIRPALLAAAIIVTTLSLGEFNVSFFLFTPTEKTLPIDLYAAYITGRLEVAAAATVWFLVLVIPAAIAIERLGGARVGQA
ncbi:MAG: ABC transporter permease subunit [Blastochloris sp.]|nr:ABC transporter permease subunit [Blastochloris sp.]